MLKKSSEKKRMWVAATAAATACPNATANPVSAIMVVPAASVASRPSRPSRSTSKGTMLPSPKHPLSGSVVCQTENAQHSRSGNGSGNQHTRALFNVSVRATPAQQSAVDNTRESIEKPSWEHSHVCVGSGEGLPNENINSFVFL